MVGITSITPSSSPAPTLPAAASLHQAFLLSGAACLLSIPTRGIPQPPHHLCSLSDCTVTWIAEFNWKETQELKKERKTKIQPDRISYQICGLTEKHRSSCARKVLEQTARNKGGIAQLKNRPINPTTARAQQGRSSSLPLSCLGSFSTA